MENNTPIFSRSQTTIMSNHNGIMEFCMSFNIATQIKSNVRLYFYKYNPINLVEIEYRGGNINFISYTHTTADAYKIIYNDVERWAKHFDDIGLASRRFVFDTATKTVVCTNDFEARESAYFCTAEKVFILDKSESKFLTNKGDIKFYVTNGKSQALEMSVLSAINQSINLLDNKYTMTISGQVVTILVSGMLGGISEEEINKELNNTEVDAGAKLLIPFRELEINPNHVSESMNGLRLYSLKKALNKDTARKKEYKETTASLTTIMLTGPDNFIRSIFNPDERINVNVDTNLYTDIKTMYIKGGAIFIVPSGNKDVDYFKRELSFDNVFTLFS